MFFLSFSNLHNLSINLSHWRVMALANIQQVAEKPVSVSLLGPVQGYLRPPMSSSCSSAAGVGLSSVYLTPLIVRDLVISLALSLTEAMGRAMSSDPVQICQNAFNYVDLYSLPILKWQSFSYKQIKISIYTRFLQ